MIGEFISHYRVLEQLKPPLSGPDSYWPVFINHLPCRDGLAQS
jgi:hypothetical protein